MTAWFNYNGIDSRDMGVVVEELPAIHRPPKNVTPTQVNGRNGRLMVDQNNFDAWQGSLKVNVFGNNLHDVYEWLSGEGWFFDSDDPTKMVFMSLYQIIKNTRFNVNGECYDSLTLTPYIQPFRYHKGANQTLAEALAYTETYTNLADGVIITNPFAVYSEPEISVTATPGAHVVMTVAASATELDTGQIIGINFPADDDTVVIDSELYDCLNKHRNHLYNQYVSMDEYPRFGAGISVIAFATGEDDDGVLSIPSKLEIKPRWRTL